MPEPIVEPNVFDEDGAPETIYLTLGRTPTTEDGWIVPSLDVGSWRPLSVGDRLVALDYASPWEFLVEVAAVDSTTGEVFYLLRHLCDLDPAATPELEATRPWLRP